MAKNPGRLWLAYVLMEFSHVLMEISHVLMVINHVFVCLHMLMTFHYKLEWGNYPVEPFPCPQDGPLSGTVFGAILQRGTWLLMKKEAFTWGCPPEGNKSCLLGEAVHGQQPQFNSQSNLLAFTFKGNESVSRSANFKGQWLVETSR